MKRVTVAKALEGRAAPLSGPDVAVAAGLPYKATIDALTHLHDSGIVVRFGRKYSSSWTLAGTPAGHPPDPLGAVEAAWRAGPPRRPLPPRGEAAQPPGLAD